MNILAKILTIVKLHQKDIFLGLCIILVSVIGFDLGRINAPHQTPDEINSQVNIYPAKPPKTVSNLIQNKVKTTPTQPRDLRVVVSKASTSKKYHFTWCPGAKKIKEANKLWFDNDIAAQKAGYTLASNCN